MVDILERLQSPQTSLGTLWPQPNLHEEAANEITRLRDETDEWEKSHNTLVKEIERLREENSRLREALTPFAEMQLWTDAYPDGPLSATSEKRFVDPLWIVAAREAIREGGKDD